MENEEEKEEEEEEEDEDEEEEDEVIVTNSERQLARRLELERRWFNNLDDKIKRAESTSLSKLIKLMMPHGVDPCLGGFSWCNPIYEGISLYTKQPIVKTQSYDHLYMPKIRMQGELPFCLPYSVFHLMTVQGSIVGKYYERRVPQVSLAHLCNVAERLELRQVKPFVELLANRVYKAHDYDDKRCRPRFKRDATLRLDILFTFCQGPLTSVNYAKLIITSVIRYGGVIFILKVSRLDGTNRTEVVPSSNENNSISLRAELKHAVYCFSAKPRKNCRGVTFTCMDSARGLIKIRGIDRIQDVWVLQIEDWISPA